MAYLREKSNQNVYSKQKSVEPKNETRGVATLARFAANQNQP